MEKLEFELHSAFEKGEWTKACNILGSEGELLRQSLSENSELLHHAIVRNAPEEVIVLLISPHIINLPSRYYHTSLHAALSWEKRWDLVPVLLQYARYGAAVDRCDFWDRTPLHLAVRCDTPRDIFTQLISHQNVNVQDVNGVPALHFAVKKERWDLVPDLLQHGADVNLFGLPNRTPLHWAACRDTPADIVPQLISPHNINLKDIYGHTALHEAVREKRWELVPVLIQYGADPSLLDAPQPDRPLMLSLKTVCINTIRGHMPVKTDAAYEGLGLPVILANAAKLKPQADAIVNKGRGK